MWFRVDDSFQGHPKAVGMTNDSLATWTRAGEWCAWQLTDGVFDAALVRQFAGDAADPDAVAQDLLDRQLWEPGGRSNVLQFHDWADWNPSRAQVLAKRKRDAERRRRWLASRRDEDTGRAVAGHGVSHGVTQDGHGVSHGVTPQAGHGVSHGVTEDLDDFDLGEPDDPAEARHAVSHASTERVSHTSPTRPDPTRRVGVGEGRQGADRSAPARPRSGAGARPARDIIAEHANRPQPGHATYTEGADSARKQFANRQRTLDAPDDPDPYEPDPRARARSQAAASRASRGAPTAPPDDDQPDDQPDDPPDDDDPGPDDIPF